MYRYSLHIFTFSQKFCTSSLGVTTCSDSLGHSLQSEVRSRDKGTIYTNVYIMILNP